MRKSGSIRKLIIDGISYTVAADANFAKTPKYAKEGIATSGDNMIKFTKQHGSVESVTVVASSDEFETLETVRDSLEEITMSYTLADGSSYTAPGSIHIDNYESEEGRVDLMLIPTDPDGWQRFAA